MSRGPGAVMRSAASFVEAREALVGSLEVAAAVYGVGPGADGVTRPTAAQVVATRRALAALVRAGRLRRLGGSWRFGRAMYATPAAAGRYEARVAATFGRSGG